jgi:NitT/TauT family transport system substrate-binding protein
MTPLNFSVLRGVCQTPAYVAHVQGFFADEGIESLLNVEPTAWMVPARLQSGESRFAVIPWTRVAAAGEKDIPLVLLCGSGFEEAAIVVRKNLAIDQVRRVSVPLRGGMKDLTAMGLIDSMGWKSVELLRQPSGDGAIISFVGEGVDAASMVEPYATMLEALGMGTIVRRTGDVWPGAPGCSLCTSKAYAAAEPEVVAAVVRAFARGAAYVREHPESAAEIASYYIGVNSKFIHQALLRNQPDINAIRNQEAMDRVLDLMLQLGYIRNLPSDYKDLAYLDKILTASHG